MMKVSDIPSEDIQRQIEFAEQEIVKLRELVHPEATATRKALCEYIKDLEEELTKRQ